MRKRPFFRNGELLRNKHTKVSSCCIKIIGDLNCWVMLKRITNSNTVMMEYSKLVFQIVIWSSGENRRVVQQHSLSIIRLAGLFGGYYEQGVREYSSNIHYITNNLEKSVSFIALFSISDLYLKLLYITLYYSLYLYYITYFILLSL